MQKKIRILCIGDSHTAGFPSFDPLYGGNIKSSYEYWLDLLLKQKYKTIKFIIENKGQCGETSFEVYRRFKALLSKNMYNLSIFWAGANDIALGYSTAEIWANLLKASKIAQNKDIKFIIINIPPMNWPSLNLIIKDLNERISSYKKNVYLCANVHNVLEEKGKLKADYDAGDGVHLSQKGYQEVGKAIFKIILPLIDNIVNSEL